MEARHRRIAAARSKLSQLDADEELMLSGPLGKSAKEPDVPSNWRSALVACGSNAFGQNTDDLDIMSATLAPIRSLLRTSRSKAVATLSTRIGKSQSHKDREGEVSQGGEKGRGSSPIVYPVQVACGSTQTGAVMTDGTAYVWGSGFGAQTGVPSLLPVKQVKQISLGVSHGGLITVDGRCFTWGSGEHGALGRGDRHSSLHPQALDMLTGQVCLQISCGAYHTAVIADKLSRISYINIPPVDNADSSKDGLDYIRPIENLECGSLFTFGTGKAGQLGHGDGCLATNVPLLLRYFNDNGLSVARVSCGMHHTLVIAVHAHNTRVFSTLLFSFGWGEHGRLGLGNQEQMSTPAQVTFPAPFHPVEISAGEQHSLAAGKQGCYSWGNNSFGQSGAGNPNSTPFLLNPQKLAIPEGMRVIKLAAGGRHSAAVTACGKLLTWGWGEEGQLGNGSEKDGHLPRPCRLPKVYNSLCTPVNVSLGLCHTVVLVQNSRYDPSKEPPRPTVAVELPKRPPTPEPEPEELPALNVEPEPLPEPEPVVEPEPTPKEPVVVEVLQEESVKAESEPEPVIHAPVGTQGILDILRNRVEKWGEEEVEQDKEEEVQLDPAPPVEPLPNKEEDFIAAQDTEPDSAPEPELEPEPIVLEEPAPVPLAETGPVEMSKRQPKTYDFDPKLNTAYRAEVRRQRKLIAEAASSASGASSGPANLPRTGSGTVGSDVTGPTQDPPGLLKKSGSFQRNLPSSSRVSSASSVASSDVPHRGSPPSSRGLAGAEDERAVAGGSAAGRRSGSASRNK